MNDAKQTKNNLKIGIFRIAAVLIALGFCQDVSINLCEKCFKSGNYDKNKLVIIDEASQAIQPSSWIPILQEINSSLLL